MVRRSSVFLSFPCAEAEILTDFYKKTMRRTQIILCAPHSVFKKYPAAKYSGTKINQDP